MCVDGCCYCPPGFEGKDCSVRACPNRCSMHGACLPSGACACFDGWQGKDCAVRCADAAASAAATAAGCDQHGGGCDQPLSEGTVRLSRGNPYALAGAGGRPVTRALLAQQLEEAQAHAPGPHAAAHAGGPEQPRIARPLLEELLHHPTL